MVHAANYKKATAVSKKKKLIALSFAHYLWFLNFRDQYGFKKESQWLSHHDFVIFETYYIPIMERRRQKWAIFMNDSHGQLPPRSAKRKTLVQRGREREREREIYRGVASFFGSYVLLTCVLLSFP